MAFTGHLLRGAAALGAILATILYDKDNEAFVALYMFFSALCIVLLAYDFCKNSWEMHRTSKFTIQPGDVINAGDERYKIAKVESETELNVLPLNKEGEDEK